MDKMLPLFHSDIFIKENVGSEEQRKDLKSQIPVSYTHLTLPTTPYV